MSYDSDRAHPSYRRDLGDGLVLRWSTSEDTEKIARLIGFVFRSSADDPPNDRMIDRTRRQMRGDYPLMGPNDYAIVEDTTREGHPAIACSCLWHHTWEFEGIPFGVGRPEYVAVEPDYRRRGLIREIFALLHARSAAEGHLVQAITGIPHFYRQFGYEYALDLGGARMVPLSLIPVAKEGEDEPFQLRDATADDIPQLMALAARRRGDVLLWSAEPESAWRYEIVEMADWDSPGKLSAIKMIVDRAGTAAGYLFVSTKRWGAYLGVYEFETVAGANLRAMIVPTLRALQIDGQSAPTIETKEPFRGIGFRLGREHPVYEALGHDLAPVSEPPYAWYIRVPDVPGFLRHVAPALERRLAHSVLAGYSGELKIDCYRGGMRLAFEQGKLTAAEPWQAPPFGEEASAGCPALIFLQLLFGYRALDELRYAFPDVWAGEEAQILLNVLFPKRLSRV
jgi:GNAT superfamily N-acetyltransferase